MAMAAVGAIAWLAGLSTWQVLAVGLAAMSIGVLGASLPRRNRGASPAPVTASVPAPAGDFDPDEVIMQDVNSGRIWRLGDVHFLSAAEKRRLAAERPHVWKSYRERVFPFPEGDPSAGQSRSGALYGDTPTRMRVGPPDAPTEGPI
jgi:hypothetical protein